MSRTRFLTFASAFALLLAACTSDTESYGDQHRTELTYDCQESIACHQSLGGPLPKKPLDDCLERTTKLVDDYSDAERALFEVTFARCQQYQGCEYVTCVSADGSYSMAHTTEIQNHCNQTVSCQLMQGMSVALDATMQCATQTSMMLDAATTSTRSAFESRYQRCSLMQACAYVSCQ